MRLIDADPDFWPEAEPGEAVYLHRLAVRRAAAAYCAARAATARSGPDGDCGAFAARWARSMLRTVSSGVPPLFRRMSTEPPIA